ncbi:MULTISPECIES: nicotinamide mononucleotide deamidase-related protein YfaY [Providencia]|uniref:nicotinamide mononucleotide deamidase-related protein YfaY n=1 Tax=Providencia TaxID=586 RepID=UPI000D6FF98D|nr:MULTISPECIES: nicotinamide mononucleotide deamidase-related protein YfaY [Providencia]AWS51324.1 competence/damage-inducible protein CinA [Providencia rettgeri]MBS0914822.1 nicotinamide mononucleotide deamidase-related protein YfaY [Providencia rettgeri]MCG5293003.1 nicotinamide mononucleotide deamidase-related protein YfaY [Providencia rettgeri]MCL0018101.1 nicotinamide mononucleotide deamidase-related protein YfaY [Providencia rettgeri]MDM9281671.1 nicotinamide mononucleotide deamidase-re
MLVVEMLSTGDEVLHGQIIDTNAAWLADCFFQQGLPLSSRTTVGDDLDSLVATFLERSLSADVLIVNGGLGPTSDDLSALAAAKAAGVPLVEHSQWIEVMERYFIARGRVMPETNRKQALLPANAELIDNPVGTACGFSLVLNGCLIFFTPGVPSEFKVMVNEQILPRLRERFTLPEPPICLRLTSFGRSESSLAKQFDSLPLPENCVLGYRSSMPIIELKLTGPASQKELMERDWQLVKQGVGDNLIFEGTEGLAQKIGNLLKEKKLNVIASEQYSAGLLNWTLDSAGIVISDSQILPLDVEQTLETLAQRAQNITINHPLSIGLVIGEYQEQYLNVALSTPDKCYVQRIHYLPNNHSQKEKQEVSVMLVLDMLSRWLNGREVIGYYEWLVQTETLILES